MDPHSKEVVPDATTTNTTITAAVAAAAAGAVKTNAAKTPRSASGSTTTKKQKQPRDPNAPKAATNAYMYYCKEERAKVRAAHKDLAFADVAHKLAENWRNLTPANKQRYADLAKIDNERYRKEMAVYNAKKQS